MRSAIPTSKPRSGMSSGAAELGAFAHTGMSDPSALTPLRPREFFSVPWSGEGEWIAAPWLRRLARRPRRFSFTTATTWLSDDVWLVHDTLTWENGRTEYRSGMARLAAEDRIRLSYDDMLGGTDLWLRADGFTFSAYQLMVAMPPCPSRSWSERRTLADGMTPGAS